MRRVADSAQNSARAESQNPDTPDPYVYWCLVNTMIHRPNLDLDMRTRLRFFSNLRNYQADICRPNTMNYG